MKVTVRGEKSLPIWSISHYLDQTSSNYHKLMTICNMCELTEQGVEHSDFVISEASIEVFEDKKITFSLFKKYLSIDSQRKGDNPDKFWHILRTYKRPVVYYKSGESFLPVFDPNGDEAFKVSRMEVNSPPIFDVSGFLGGIIELFSAGRQDQREQLRLQHDLEEQEERRLEQRGRNLQELLKASEILERDNVHPGIKHFAQQEIDHIMESQKRLNAKSAISGARINTRV